MKINCGPSWWEKHLAKKEWHLFFALWPRRIAKGDCRWLETIERKGEFMSHCGCSGWTWEYRCLKS